MSLSDPEVAIRAVIARLTRSQPSRDPARLTPRAGTDRHPHPSTLLQPNQHMRRSRSVSTLAAAFALVVLPAALSAQQAPAAAPAATRPVGCRGTTSQTSSTTFLRADSVPVEFPGYPTIESVQPGSPAEKAGFRYGDMVVAQGGRDLIGNPPTQPALAGDTVVFVVRRNDVEIPLTVVMGRWDPPEAAEGVTRVCRPV
jgi:hypothetical protein